MPLMKFYNSIFICSKPLHFFNAASIVRDYRIEVAKVIVVDQAISDCESFYEFVYSNYLGCVFSEVVFFPSYELAIKSVGEKFRGELFVEDDRVSLYYLFKKVNHEVLLVYEEGMGTYLGHYKYFLSWAGYLRWYISSIFFGCGLDFGASRTTKHIFVRYPEIFKKLKPKLADKVKRMPGHISEIKLLKYEILEYCSDDFKKIVAKERMNEDVALILGTWGGLRDEDFESISAKGHGEILYKSHPHDHVEINKFTGVREYAWLPAEAMILFLANAYETVTVYHYSSSVCFYKGDLPGNVRFVCLGDTLFRYEKIMKTALE
tara:strand:- start:8632 stop:9591 length:960 start_codon:yes stop_codon:yes gene_type:complete